jgi:hypothetical protein
MHCCICWCIRTLKTKHDISSLRMVYTKEVPKNYFKYFQYQNCSVIDWLIEWLIDCFIACVRVCLIDWLIDWLIDCAKEGKAIRWCKGQESQICFCLWKLIPLHFSIYATIRYFTLGTLLFPFNINLTNKCFSLFSMEKSRLVHETI